MFFSNLFLPHRGGNLCAILFGKLSVFHSLLQRDSYTFFCFLESLNERFSLASFQTVDIFFETLPYCIIPFKELSLRSPESVVRTPRKA